MHKVQDNFVKEKSIIAKQHDCAPLSSLAQIQTRCLRDDSGMTLDNDSVSGSRLDSGPV